MMPGYFIHIWLFFFAVFARESKVEEVKKGLYSRVELTGEKLDQHTADSLKSVEWTKRKGSLTCLCFIKTNTTYSVSYSQCCGTARFYLNNNTLILENVTERDEGVFIETIVTANGTKKWLNVTLTIQYPPNAIEIVVSWTSSTSVTLKCEVSGLFQHLMWKREGVSILEKHRHSFSERNQTLHISNITSSEYGSYSCIASNAYGESEKHTYITGNGTRDETRSDQTVLSSGLTLTCVLGLCLVFYCLYKYHHSDADKVHGIYQTSLSRERAVRPPLQRNTFRSLVTLRSDPQTGKKPLFCIRSLMIRPQHVLKLERTNYVLKYYIK
ncbi:intraflagellar transport protein 46 homolog isoform X9 [Carassius gibelio]|uniref:intraflagellar transport protein 46 homolog isoform X9 n=1 Tax=Carassius gibelio TaxID=101364 RepID=UPI002278EAE5|nr:intraflagellar transport protein 46 homolog isoform X9 [Carassius gibelio]